MGSAWMYRFESVFLHFYIHDLHALSKIFSNTYSGIKLIYILFKTLVYLLFIREGVHHF